MKKIHLGYDCHPYAYEFYIFCSVELPYTEETAAIVTEDIKKVTCKGCISANDKIEHEMRLNNILDKDGNLLI